MIVHSILLCFLYFYGIFFVISSLSFLILCIWILCFLGEPGQRFADFVYAFKEPTPGFID